jgi:hypothetical protein
MLEELLFQVRETPGLLTGLGVLGVVCLLWVGVVLTRGVRWHLPEWIFEILLIRQAGRWLRANPDTFALGICVLCLLGTVALLADPVRLLAQGKRADGIVAAVVESAYRDRETREDHIRSTATIRFEADGKIIEFERATSRRFGSTCIAGCYARGERMTVLYLAHDPSGARIGSFLGLFGTALFPGIAGIIALMFWWLLRAERAAGKSRTSDPAAG